MKKYFMILTLSVLLLGIYGCATQINNNIDANDVFEEKNEYIVNKPFEFNDLEITVHDNIEFTVVDNQFDEDNGKDVVKIPITIKNLKDETHSLNIFYVSVYGSTGIESSSKETHFDDSIFYSGNLKTGASYTTYLYYLYDGDGTYTVEFEDFFDKINIDIEIKK